MGNKKNNTPNAGVNTEMLGKSANIIVVDEAQDANNALANFINSDDTKENTVHENASAASDNDEESSDSSDLNDDLNWESEVDTVPENLKDIPKKYWKFQTV